MQHVRRSPEEIAANRARYEEHQRKGLEFAPKALPAPSPLPAPPVDAVRVVHQEVIPGGWYWSTRIKRGETLRIAQQQGFSTVTLVAWNAAETSERLNLPDTVKMQWTTALSKGRVIFSDISQDLLDYCRKAADAEGLLARCAFVLAAADRLTGVADASVDAVTTRSVLIYVKDKAAALREFYRVLKPGGRVSLFEPINVLMSAADPDRFSGYDVTPVRALAAKVQAVYESIQPPGVDPMIDFDDRDLVRHTRNAGFPDIDLELRVSVKARKQPIPWEQFLRTSGNPLVPTFGDALDRSLSQQEAAEFTSYLRPLVETGAGLERRAVAYLTAAKE